MTQESSAGLDRAQVLLDDVDTTIALTKRLFEWRAAAAWSALSGLIALSILCAERFPLVWVAVVLLLGGAAYFWLARRRSLRASAAAMLAQARTDLARDAAVDNASWDRSRIHEVPEHYFQPVDTVRPAQLEALLRIPPAVLKSQVTTVPSAIVATGLLGVMVLAGLAFAVLVPLTWMVGSVESLLNDRFAGVPFWVIAAFVSGCTLLLGYFETLVLHKTNRTLSSLLVAAATAELPRMWRLDPAFTQGEVVRWTPTGYILDPTRMTVPPRRANVGLAAGLVIVLGFMTITVLVVLCAVLGKLASTFS